MHHVFREGVMSNEEIVVLRQQLGEALEAGDDPVELSSLAGMLVRLGDGDTILKRAESWRDASLDIVDVAFDAVDFDELVEDISEAVGRNAADDEVEEALFDFDEMAIAAWWVGQADRFEAAGQKLVETVRGAPDNFKPLAKYALYMSDKSKGMGGSDHFSYWSTIAKTG
jgi:hypothetical protein